MPTLLSEKVVTLEMRDLQNRVPICRPPQPPARAPGAHQSDILAYVARKIGVLKPGEKLEDEYPLLWGLGCAWEEYIMSFYPDMEWQPGELTVDGISMNCDGLSVIDGEPTVEEAKLTFKKERDGA